MKKSLLLSLALGLGLAANADVVRTQVTDVDQLQAGHQYQIACYNLGWTDSHYKWISTSSKHVNDQADATTWTFEAVDPTVTTHCTVADHTASFALKNDEGKYLNFVAGGSGYIPAMVDAQCETTAVDFFKSSLDNANSNKVVIGGEDTNIFGIHTWKNNLGTTGSDKDGNFGYFGGVAMYYNALPAYQWNTYYVIYEITEETAPVDPVEPTYVRMDRSGWTITGCSEWNHSDGGTDGGYADIIDDNADTYWHSNWQADKVDTPHFFIVDLGKTDKVAGIGYLGRSNAGKGNGYVQDAAVYVVDNVDAITCNGNGNSHTSLTTFLADKTPAWTGDLKSEATNPAVECTAYFDAEATGRYVIFQVLSSTGEEGNWAKGNQHANCAEFYTYAIEATEPEPVVPPTEEQEYTWEYTFTSKNDMNQDGAAKELNGATWTTSGCSVGLNYNATKGIQFGTSKAPIGKDIENEDGTTTDGTFYITGKTFANASKITKIEVNTSGANGMNGTLAVKVGDTAFTTVKDETASETYAVTTTATDVVWEGDAAGEVVFAFNQTSSVALYIKSIKVTYTAEKEIKAREVEDVEFENVAALIEANNDFDNVILKNPVTVVFQNNRNLFVQDATGAMQIFGDLGVTLTAGQTLTGVKGKYSLYNGYTPEIVEPVADSFTVGEGEMPEPTTLTAALATTDANKYVKVTGATVTTEGTIVATVGDVEYTLINAYNVDGVEDAENVTLTGIVNVTATGLCRIYLLSFEAVELPDYKAFHIGAGTSNAWNSIRIDDSILGEHSQTGALDAAGATDNRTRSFTYSAWIRPEYSGTLMGMKPDQFRNNQGTMRIYSNAGKLSWEYRTATGSTYNVPGGSQAEVCDITNGEWVFLTVVADQEGHKTTLYKNGHEVSSVETDLGIGLLADEEQTLYVSDGQTAMDVEQVQLWTKALTPEEVRESYFMTRESEVPDELAGFYIVSNDDVKMTNLGKSDVDAMLTEYKNTTLWGWLATETKTGNSAMYTVDVEGHTPAQVTVTIEQPESGATISVDPAADSYEIFSEVTVNAELADEGNIAIITLTNEYGSQTVEAGSKVILDANTTITAEVTEAPEVHYYGVSVATNPAHYTAEIVGDDETDYGFTEGSKVTVRLKAADGHARALALLDGETELTLTPAAQEVDWDYEYVIEAIDRDIDLVLNSALYYTVSVNTVEGQFSYEFASPADEYAEGTEIYVVFERKNDDARIISLKANDTDVTDALVGFDDEPGVYEYSFKIADDVVLTLDSDLFYTLTVNADAAHFTYEVENAAEAYQAGQTILVKFTKANELALVKEFKHNDEAANLSAAAEGAAHHFEYTIDGIQDHTVLTLVSDLQDGIQGIMVQDGENTVIYDLQGRRLNKTATGVYIINGQKVRK